MLPSNVGHPVKRVFSLTLLFLVTAVQLQAGRAAGGVIPTLLLFTQSMLRDTKPLEAWNNNRFSWCSQVPLVSSWYPFPGSGSVF